mgnify:CR=1 FL=1
MSALIDFVLHIDNHLVNIVNTFGNSSYFILFAIIFIETGVVILPFLPGDSLLFAAAALAANPVYHLHISWFVIAFLIACIAGDSSNYWIGHNAEKILSRFTWFKRFLNEDSLAKGQEFFEKHGAMSIILARFMPIIRTFVPFVAAGSGFSYRKVVRYNWIACFAWGCICSAAGYFCGNIPVGKANFSAVVIGNVVVCWIPATVGLVRTKFASKSPRI